MTNHIMIDNKEYTFGVDFFECSYCKANDDDDCCCFNRFFITSEYQIDKNEESYSDKLFSYISKDKVLSQIYETFKSSYGCSIKNNVSLAGNADDISFVFGYSGEPEIKVIENFLSKIKKELEQ